MLLRNLSLAVVYKTPHKVSKREMSKLDIRNSFKIELIKDITVFYGTIHISRLYYIWENYKHNSLTYYYQ
jgi:hypothetical protein